MLSFINNIIYYFLKFFFLLKIYSVMITGPQNINLAYTYKPRKLNIAKLRKCYTEAIKKS